MVHEIAKNFDKNTDAYERARPSYPQAALEFITNELPEGAQILDLAAGTGKFTRMLIHANSVVGKHWQIEAIEPSSGMRDKFAEVVSGVKILEGTAEQIPFPDSSFDLVTTAQSFHWFSNLAALREIYRVLKPNGRFVMLWNLEDRSTAWVGALRDIYEAHENAIPQYRLGIWRNVFDTPEARALFSPIAQQTFSSVIPSTASHIWERILSKSYITNLSNEQRELVREQVFNVLRTQMPSSFDPENPDATVDAPFNTDVFTCHKL